MPPNPKSINKVDPLLPQWDFDKLKKINASLIAPDFKFTFNQIDFRFTAFHQTNINQDNSLSQDLEPFFNCSDDFFIKCFNLGAYTRPRPYCYYIEPEIYLALDGKMSLPPIFTCVQVEKNESLTHDAGYQACANIAWWQSSVGLPSKEILEVIALEQKAWHAPYAFTCID